MTTTQQISTNGTGPEIVPATREEFKAITWQHGFGPRRPEVVAVLALEVDQALRIRQHEHKLAGKKANACILAQSINRAGRNHNMKLSARHDGDDLLVMRIQ